MEARSLHETCDVCHRRNTLWIPLTFVAPPPSSRGKADRQYGDMSKRLHDSFIGTFSHSNFQPACILWSPELFRLLFNYCCLHIYQYYIYNILTYISSTFICYIAIFFSLHKLHIIHHGSHSDVWKCVGCCVLDILNETFQYRCNWWISKVFDVRINGVLETHDCIHATTHTGIPSSCAVNQYMDISWCHKRI